MGSRHLGFGCRAHPRTHQRLIERAGFIGMARVVFQVMGVGARRRLSGETLPRERLMKVAHLLLPDC